MSTRRMIGLVACLAIAIAIAIGQIVATGRSRGSPEEPKTKGEPKLGEGKRAQEVFRRSEHSRFTACAFAP
jgi:hypothetical protein